MYKIEIVGDGKTTHETTDIKKVKAFVINSIRSATDLSKFSVNITEQA